MAPKRQQTLLSMFGGRKPREGETNNANAASSSSSSSKKKKPVVKKKESGSSSIASSVNRSSSSSGNDLNSKRTPDAIPLHHHEHETNDDAMKENDDNHNNIGSSNNPELSPKRKRRRADAISSDDGNTLGTPDSIQPERAAKARKTTQAVAGHKEPSPTATAEAEAHPYNHHHGNHSLESCDQDVRDRKVDVSGYGGSSSVKPSVTHRSGGKGGVHTPTTFAMVSQTSIDTPPVGVSRLPSQDDGNNVVEDKNDELIDVEMRNSLDEDDEEVESNRNNNNSNHHLTNVVGHERRHQGISDTASSGTILQVNDDHLFPSGNGTTNGNELEMCTPIPVPRNSMPSSFKFTTTAPIKTPRPVRHQNDATAAQQGEAKAEGETHSGSDGSCYIPLIGDASETQERPAKNQRESLFSNTPIDEGNEDDDDEDEDKSTRGEDTVGGSSKKRHTMDLGSFYKTQGEQPQLQQKGGAKAKAKAPTPSSSTHKGTSSRKGIASKAKQQPLRTNQQQQKSNSNDTIGAIKSSHPSPTISSIDPIEEITQTDDEIEKVEARTSRATQLLQAAATRQQQQTTSSSSTTGSLFASANVTQNSPSSNDLSSPAFDPPAFDAAKMLYSPPNKESTLRFSLIASTFDQIEALKSSGAGSRKKMTTLLANLFRLVIWWCPKDLISVIYFCLNKVAPDYEGLEVGVGESMLIKIMVEVYGRSEQSIKNDLKKHEDLGKVAELSRCSMMQLYKPPPLTIQSVFSALKSLPTVSGKHVQEQKKATIRKILTAAEKSEPKCVIRFLQQKMRVGVQSATVYQALAFAFALTSPQAPPFGPSARPPVSDIRKLSKKKMAQPDIDTLLSTMESSVKTALSEVSNVEVVTKYLFEGCDGATLATRCTVTPGIPVQPMLAKPTKGLQEVLTRFADCEFTCEFKYDGERAQIHLLPNKTVVVFSRNLENLTTKYPDVINAAKEAFNPELTECILDSEVVAYDTKTQKIQPFQILSTRKRKGVEAEDVTVQVCIFAFDCIQYNGQSLTKHTFEERRQYLQKCFSEIPCKFMFARHSEMTTLDEIDSFFQEAVDANCEGLMVKTLNTHASYEPSKRSLNWLKIKKDYLEHLTDSVDLVPIGAYLGRGKRAKWYGTYLLACYNPDEEVYQTVCKVGTGFSDDNLTEFYNYFQTKLTSVKDPSYQVDEKLAADVWFEPSAVWEVRAADLSLSPVHSGGMGLKHPTKGIGLRFPRFVRVRDDKKPEQATTNIQIVEMYDNQFNEGKKGATRGRVLNDEDDDDEDD